MNCEGEGFATVQGIETVRRDGCPALVKMMEKSLRLLFTSRDLSQVRPPVNAGKVSNAGVGVRPQLQDFATHTTPSNGMAADVTGAEGFLSNM